VYNLLRWYTQGGVYWAICLPGCVYGGVYRAICLPVCVPWCIPGYMPPCVYNGGIPGYMPPCVYNGGYTGLYASLCVYNGEDEAHIALPGWEKKE